MESECLRLLVIKTFMKKMMSLPRYLMWRVINNSSSDFMVSRKKHYLNHLQFFKEFSVGPIQRDEALLLYAVVKTVDPKTILEFGFLEGHSSINFLNAMASDAMLYSYDISDASMQKASKIYDQRFRFIFKSQADFEWPDVDNRLIDLVFFDASHDFPLNVVTFEKVKECLSESALIIVHDTGVWYGGPKGLRTPDGHFEDGSIGTGYIHQPGERKFVNYVRANAGIFNQIHLHSTTKFMHGITILQKNIDELSV